MKLKNIMITGLAILLLPACKKDEEAAYTPIEMVSDVVWATSYYSAIFREAEDAWALVDKKQYATDPITEESGSKKKTITFKEPSEGKYVVDIEYNAWSLNEHTILMGTITIDLPDKDVYGQAGKTAIVKLTNRFSINGQIVTGNIPITCQSTNEGEERIDRYDFKLNTAAIHSFEDDKKVIITCEVTNGVFIRVNGAETKAVPEDDSWSFTGTMTGMLRDDVNLTYSNTVSNTEGATLLFERTCYKALQGACKLTVKGQSDMYYTYGAECDASIQIETIH